MRSAHADMCSADGLQGYLARSSSLPSSSGDLTEDPAGHSFVHGTSSNSSELDGEPLEPWVPSLESLSWVPAPKGAATFSVEGLWHPPRTLT